MRERERERERLFLLSDSSQIAQRDTHKNTFYSYCVCSDNQNTIITWHFVRHSQLRSYNVHYLLYCEGGIVREKLTQQRNSNTAESFNKIADSKSKKIAKSICYAMTYCNLQLKYKIIIIIELNSRKRHNGLLAFRLIRYVIMTSVNDRKIWNNYQ